jgi:hypothetical protein
MFHVMDTVVDLYKPRTVSDMAGSSDWARLVDMLRREDPPNIILAGPAGVGKSCALRLTLGGTITMWLQCSRDPTLRDNRDRIKAAARRRVGDGGIAWIVLENAGLLHTDAQAFLRRIIETSLGATRFVLEVRDLAALAEPLLSRAVLFNAPQLMEHEIRAEILHRAPTVTVKMAGHIAAQSGGNVRWAILQGLGGGDGLIDDSVPPAGDSWTDVLAVMEAMNTTGTSPRAWSKDTSIVWERAGGACPWALVAHMLAQRVK